MILTQSPIRVFPMYHNGYSFRHGFDLYVGPWGIRVKPPWSSGWFSNGSKWTTGWFKWEEDRELWGI